MTPTLTTPNNNAEFLSSSRNRYLYVLLMLLVISSGVAAVVLVAISLKTPQSPVFILFTTIAFLANLFAYIMLRRGHSDFVTYMVLAEVIAGMLSTMQVEFSFLMFNSVLAVVTSAVLASRNVYRAVTVFLFGAMLVLIAQSIQQTGTIDASVPRITLLITLAILSLTTRYFTNQAMQAAQVAASSANLLQAAAATGEIIGKLLKLDEVLPQAVELIRERFAFYHVQIFLLDEAGENAQLAASTGSVGQQLFERRHSLPVGSRSVIGRVTSTMQPVTANDTDSFYHRNELLPNTRSELALPILDGDKIIGALDVQSRRYELFTAEVIQALQVVANQLGTTIRNARLFEEQETTTRDARRFLLESETNLREIQRLNQQLTRSGWKDYLETGKPVSGVTVQSDEMRATAEWSTTLLQASQGRQSVTSQHNGQRIIAVPMMLGNEVIGAIEVEANDSVQEADVTEMVNAVAQRLALSLDKARLFEESQEATAREQRINEIVTRYQSVNNVDELLRITLQELSQSLGATHSSIRLGAVPVASLNGEGQA
ncbi:MAG: GAF domain-containing protein [Chloroflexota bacterium]|nr:GAF domain-containing protein [Anaerolineae bacterium]